MTNVLTNIHGTLYKNNANETSPIIPKLELFYVCMYVCIEVALRGVPMERGVQLGLGEGPSKVGSMSQPLGTIDIVLRTQDQTHALVCVF